ncbi:MAG TPA: hypothetical protein VFE62_16730 [Gemmataceae bacterium]|nr:hypothetical protein [Gemmataceae bacterium]
MKHEKSKCGRRLLQRLVMPDPHSLLLTIAVDVEGGDECHQLLIVSALDHTEFGNAGLTDWSLGWDAFGRTNGPNALALLAWCVPHRIDQERQNDCKTPGIATRFDLPKLVCPPIVGLKRFDDFPAVVREDLPKLGFVRLHGQQPKGHNDLLTCRGGW